MSGEVPADGLMEALRECDRQRMGQVHVIRSTPLYDLLRQPMAPAWARADLARMEADRDDALTEVTRAERRAERQRARAEKWRARAEQFKAEREAALDEVEQVQDQAAREREVAKYSLRVWQGARDSWAAEAERLREALAVAGDELRTAQATARGMRQTAAEQVTAAQATQDAAVRELQRLRIGLRDLASSWDVLRPVAHAAQMLNARHQRQVRALLNTPQEAHQ